MIAPPACFPAHSFPAALDFVQGLQGTKLELHVPCHNLTNDMLWDHMWAMRPHLDGTFLSSLCSRSFIICLVRLWLDRAKLGVAWQDPKLCPSREKHQLWNPKIRTWVREGNPSTWVLRSTSNPSHPTLQNYGLEELVSNLAWSQYYLGLGNDRNPVRFLVRCAR